MRDFTFPEPRLDSGEIHLISEFGSSGEHAADIDLAIVLKEEKTFESCLSGIVRLISEIEQWSIKGTVSPSLEIFSFLDSKASEKNTHLLIYPSPWVFERLESPNVKQCIKSFAKYYPIPTSCPVNDYTTLYFDLIQKITNSLVLLLNKDRRNIERVEKHALYVAKYVKRWAPVAFDEIDNSKERLVLSEAKKIYGIIG